MGQLETKIIIKADGSEAQAGFAKIVEAITDTAQYATDANGKMTASAQREFEKKLRIQDAEMKQQRDLNNISIQEYQQYLQKRSEMTGTSAKAEASVRMEMARIGDVDLWRGLKTGGMVAQQAGASMSSLGLAGQMAGQSMNAFSQIVQASALKMSAMQMATMGLMAGIGMLMMAYRELQKDMQGVIDTSNETLKIYQALDADRYTGKLNKIKKAYDEGTISADEYRKAAAAVNKQLLTNAQDEKLAENMENAEKLTERLTAKWWDLGGMATKAWDKMSGGAVSTKLQTLNNNIYANEIKLKKDIEKANEEAENTITEKRKEQLEKRKEEAIANHEQEVSIIAALDAQYAASALASYNEEQENYAAQAELRKFVDSDTFAYKMELLDMERDKYLQIANDKSNSDEERAALSLQIEKNYTDKKIALEKLELDNFIKNNKIAATVHKGAGLFMMSMEKAMVDYKMSAGKAVVASAKAAAGAMVADALEAQSKQWAKEGAAGVAKGLINMNPGQVAGGVALLALAGVTGIAAGAIRKSTAMQKPEQAPEFAVAENSYSPSASGSAALSTGGASGSEKVAQTSNVIHLSSILNVYGNVIGIDNFKQLFYDWQAENIRLVAADLGG